MEDAERFPYLRPAGRDDARFLFDVFATTWEDEVAALPNPKLAAHVLRIQHTAQERRFDSMHPGCERFVVLDGGAPAGRLYLHVDDRKVHAIDMTLLPEVRSRGIGTRIVEDLLGLAREKGQSVTLRVPRRNPRAATLYHALGFRLVTVDDLDSYFEWAPPLAADTAAVDHLSRGLRS